jgi:DNA-binding NarL/FixJ family response regulator
VLHPKIIEKLLKQAMIKQSGTVDRKVRDLLSDREMEMLKLLATGMSNKEIADKLYLSLRTVKAHMSNIFTKMNVASRSEALVESLRKGLLTLDDIKKDDPSQ